ncbi:MAG: ATP-binding protein [Pseudomonadota bacterium]|nr:ATP-binding protein [Pseudomonadota bacterium]
MILPPATVTKFNDLKLHVIASVIEKFSLDYGIDINQHLDFFDALLDAQIAHNQSSAHKRERKSSGMRWPDATFAASERLCSQIKQTVLEYIKSCDWIATGKHIMLSGRSSAGKTHLACAIGNQVILHGYRVRFYRFRDLLMMLRAADNDGELTALIKKLLRIHLIIIDDWTVDKLSRQEQAVLFELVEKREKRGSFVITTQFDAKLLHEAVGGDTIADAILSRIVTLAYPIVLDHDIDFRQTDMTIPARKSSKKTGGQYNG